MWHRYTVYMIHIQFLVLASCIHEYLNFVPAFHFDRAAVTPTSLHLHIHLIICILVAFFVVQRIEVRGGGLCVVGGTVYRRRYWSGGTAHGATICGGQSGGTIFIFMGGGDHRQRDILVSTATSTLNGITNWILHCCM